MKKDMIRWGLGLGVLLALYILVAFLIPFAHTATFWVSVLFTLIAFGVVAAAFYIAFVKNPDARSRFYGFPIARIGAIYGLAQLAAGILFMALAAYLPVWAAVLVFAITLGTAIIGLISAEAVVEEIKVQDVKLKKDVTLMRGLQSKANQMAAQCDNPDAAAAVKRFAEDLRYSDPVSSDAIAEVEADLSAAVDELQAAIVDGDSNAVVQLCRKASGILAERNRLCKLNKQNDNPVQPVRETPEVPVQKNTVKIVAFAALALCGVFLVVLLANVVIMPNIRYNKAVKLMNNGSAIEAYDAFMAMEGYKDSAEKAASIYDRYRLEKLQTAEVGDIVLLGNYELDGDSANGQEEVEWLVLEKKEDQLLLVSRYALDSQPYHETRTNVTWETSTIRKWLNNGFLNSVFSEEERNQIPAVTVPAEKNARFNTDPGADTEDHIFLLSAGEVTQYFGSYSERVCLIAGSEDSCSWWLRTTGKYPLFASVINEAGDVNEEGEDVNGKNVGVRPALWVDLIP